MNQFQLYSPHTYKFDYFQENQYSTISKKISILNQITAKLTCEHLPFLLISQMARTKRKSTRRRLLLGSTRSQSRTTRRRRYGTRYAIKSTVTAGGLPKKPHRFHPGTIVNRDIQRYQHSSELLISKAAFGRLAREIAAKFSKSLRFEANALLALQEATETYMVSKFQFCNFCALHEKRITIMSRDIQLVSKILKEG